MEGNYTIGEITVLEDIENIGLVQISPDTHAKEFLLSDDFMILEISRKEIYGGE